MNKNKKWFLAVGMAAMLAANGLVMAATQDSQDTSNGKRHHTAAQGEFAKRGGMKGPQGDHKALLEFLKMDAQTFKAAMKEGRTLAALAQEKGISEQSLKDFMVEQRTKRIDEGVKAGRIPADKAEQMKANMEKRVSDRINGKHPMTGHGSMRHGSFDKTQLLELLKIDGETLKAEMKAGKSLAAVAKERGVSEIELRDFIVEQRTKRIDEGVKDGRIPAAKAEQMKANMEKRVSDMINGKHPLQARKHKPQQ